MLYYSPNSYLPTWGPSCKPRSFIGVRRFGLALTTFIFVTHDECRSHSRIIDFQNVALAPARVPNPYCVNLLLECLLSKCCCGPHEVQYFDVCNITSTIVTIKIVQTRIGIPSKLEFPIFCLGRPYAFSFKNECKYMLIWSASFWWCLAIFRILNIS